MSVFWSRRNLLCKGLLWLPPSLSLLSQPRWQLPLAQQISCRRPPPLGLYCKTCRVPRCLSADGAGTRQGDPHPLAQDQVAALSILPSGASSARSQRPLPGVPGTPPAPQSSIPTRSGCLRVQSGRASRGRGGERASRQSRGDGDGDGDRGAGGPASGYPRELPPVLRRGVCSPILGGVTRVLQPRHPGPEDAERRAGRDPWS